MNLEEIDEVEANKKSKVDSRDEVLHIRKIDQ